MALAVLASVLAAGLQIAGGSAARAVRLEELTYASWVAFNRLAEIELAAQWPADLEVRDAVTMGGQRWDRRTRVTETPDPGVRWVRVEVRSGGAESSSSGQGRSAAMLTRTALVAKHP